MLSLAEKAGARRPSGTEDRERISCLSRGTGGEARGAVNETGGRDDARRRGGPRSGGRKEMRLSNVPYEKQRSPVRSLAHDLRRALLNPLRAWNGVRHWALLARHADVPYAALVRYRRELLDDREFQGHLERCLEDVHHRFGGLDELFAVVLAVQPGRVIG